MWLKRNIVMLPADVSKRYNCTEGLIVKCVKSWTPIGNTPREIDKLSISKNWSKGVLDYYKPQHLYITTSDEKIKVGEWVINRFNEIHQVTKNDSKKYIKTCKKIIATTDTSLISINEQYFDVNKSRKSAVLEQKTLPQISQQFIEKRIEEYNKCNVIAKVEVQYHDVVVDDYRVLKVNSDNTINVRRLKSSWSREELHDLLGQHEYDKGIIDWKNFIPDFCSEVDYPIVENWFEKNE